MREDFSGTPDTNAQGFPLLPDGEYLCVLEQVRELSTKAGDLMWGLQFAVVGGEHQGAKVFDNLVFSDAAASRRKLIFKRLGYDVDQPFDVEVDDLLGKQVYLTVEEESYQDKVRNKVPFAGYRAVKELDLPDSDHEPPSSEFAVPGESPPMFDMPDQEVPF